MAITYADLLGPNGEENNMGGTKQIFYFARYDDIATFGAPAAEPATPDLKYVISTAHVMKTGTKFQKMYTTIDTSEIEGALIGEIDGRSHNPILRFFYPGLRAEINQFINDCKNDKFIILVPLPDGTVYQIGEEGFPATIAPTPATGTTTGRGRGTNFEAMSYQPYLYIYDAEVPLTPAS